VEHAVGPNLKQDSSPVDWAQINEVDARDDLGYDEYAIRLSE